MSDIIEHLLYPATFFAAAAIGVLLFLFLNTLFRHKLSDTSSFIISMVIFLAVIFGGQNLWFAEKLDIVTEGEGDFARLIIRILLGVASILGIRYFLMPPNEYGNSNMWKYIVGFIFFLSVILFFLTPVIFDDYGN